MSEHVKKDHNALSLKTKILLLVGTPLIVILICSVVIYYSAQSIVENDVFEEEPTVVEYEGTDNAEDAAKVLEGLIDDAVKSNTVKYHHSTSVRISDIDGNDEDDINLNKLIDYMAGDISGGISGLLYKDEDADYGEKFDIPGGIKFFADGSEYTVEQPEEQGMLDLVFETEAPDEKIAAAYKEDITKADSVFEEYKDVFDIVSKYSEPAHLRQYARINAGDGQIVKVQTERSYNIRLKVKFKGSFEELETRLINFRYTVSDNYEFSFAGIKIGQDVIKIHKSDYENLEIIANVSKNATPDEFSITYKSTAESIASVDENGMVEAHGQDSVDPVKVTVTLNYLGNTYEDEILVYVIEEADSVTISPHTAAVNKGETVQLTANIKPKNATIRTVKWLSEDESIATVDENGVVTGVSAGTVPIIAVTDDGGLMTACNVTVNE